MKESAIYTPSEILADDLSKNDLDFLDYLYRLSKNKEEDISIDRINDKNSVVEKFFEPYVNEFKEHKFCFRRCEGEKELTRESQHFECIPAGQYVLDTHRLGNVKDAKIYNIILPDENKEVFICDALVLRNQKIEFFLAGNDEMSEGSFTVLKYDPYTFNHNDCKKNPCINQNAPCCQIDQGSSVKFIIEQAISLFLGSFCDHPYYNFFKEHKARTGNNDLMKTFLLDKPFIVETWEKHEKEKKLFSSRNNFYKEGFGGWLISSGLYLKYNKKHSYKKKMLILTVGASFLGGGLFLYDNYKKNVDKKDA